MEIKVRNVNQAFSDIFWRLKAEGATPEKTRNGPAIVVSEPVITTYKYPQERVLFHAQRDANPIFHCLEGIWMLAGRRDVSFLQMFNSKIGQYSDDGKVFNAAYGYRWRKHFGYDQLEAIVQLLRKDPDTRQAILQMWDSDDLVKKTKDKACNMSVVFDTRGSKLNMTVFNRSNDIWYGAYGANAVHFSMLQEFVSAAINYRIGCYRQVSNNLHLYTELYDASRYIKNPPTADDYDFYSRGDVRPLPLMIDGDYKKFLQECEIFCREPYNEKIQYHNPFFTHVAHPMAMVSRVRRSGAGDGRGYAAKIRATDWRKAVMTWINNRELARAEREVT